VTSAFQAGREALRWVTGVAVPAAGGATWPETTAPGAPNWDHLYDGTAGVLFALAEARLSGVTDFDDHASAAAGRLRGLVAAQAARGITPDRRGIPHNGLYTGLSGYAAALHAWAAVSADGQAAQAAQAAMRDIAALAGSGQPVSTIRDLLAGEAGILLTLVMIGNADLWPAAALIADHLVAEADWLDGGPDWYADEDISYYLPNFSHGAAGISYALAAASGPLRRPDLLDIAQSAGRRLARLGSRPDGTLAVPHSIPSQDSAAPVSYGWCHGPAGTVRLFILLDRLRPGDGRDEHAAAGLRAVRGSGLPARLYPGFWDNVGQCCGTAGVGELALDRYQQTGDEQWLAWAQLLARDVLGRSITDESGVRWSHTEHRASPPELEPAVGWMQGAAGIAAWLLRLARAQRDGASAQRIWWPDRPGA
jgi:lantibiotic modifying enzyme